MVCLRHRTAKLSLNFGDLVMPTVFAIPVMAKRTFVHLDRSVAEIDC